MKKIIILMLVLMGGSQILPGAGTAEEDACQGIDMKALQKHLPIGSHEIVSKRSVNGLCEVVMKIRNSYVPVYANKDFVIAGKMFKNRNHITNKTLEKLKKNNFMKNIKLINKAVAFTYKPEKQSGRFVYMFTDPLCPHCHDAESEVKKMADESGVAVHTLLTSVHGKKGTEKCIEAVCRSFGLDNYSSIKWKLEKNSDNFQCQRGKDINAMAETASDMLGIEGVPAFFMDDGTYVSGADMQALKKAVEKSVAKKNTKKNTKKK